jgi:catechol 2,3-dioxygenase-like lactoylglutathione lyase family enzyme
VHVSVGDLDASIRFYSQLFAADPVVRKADYAKWMLEDPRVNFAISQRDGRPGVQHLGIQVENRAELAEVYKRLRRAEGPVIEQGETTCCYAHSEKSWIEDPQGVRWEAFLTTGQSAEYGTDEIRPEGPKPAATACCAPSCCASGAGDRCNGQNPSLVGTADSA